jgi:fatty-acyl-CoA synthase
VNGLMMDFPLTVARIVRRAETLHARKEVVSRRPDGSLHRTTYGEVARRARRLASALGKLGYADGARVATLCWNHSQHLEVYFGAPLSGNVIHTLNLRLHPSDLGFIASHAGDRMLILDESQLELYRSFAADAPFEHVVVVGDAPPGMLAYEELVAQGDDGYEEPELDERAAAAMCYTSGTTGRPKGVLYDHRSVVLHALTGALPSMLGIEERDVTMPVVPMFHANAWGFPYIAAMVGAKQVYPGPYLDPESIVELLERERVTISSGVPTIWLGVLQLLDREPGKWDLSSVRRLVVGGSAAPRSLIEALEQRHGLSVRHAWGMTEMSPLGTCSDVTGDLEDAPADVRYAYRAKQGTPSPLVEVRARGDDGIVPWDGRTMGELEVRGASVASAYYDTPEATDRWTEDGWFRTGDIVTIDERGYVEIQDRAKDLVKSGGEWISTVALENALMAHPAIAEAAVISVPNEKWDERPLGVVVLKENATCTPDELREFLAPQFAKWWLPDAFEFVEAIPKTAVGKFKKTELRERFSTLTAT